MRYAAILSLSTILLAGCGGTTMVEVIDLNKVLDIFEETLVQLDAEKPDAAEIEADTIKVDQTADDATMNAKFVGQFAKNLNAAKLVSSRVGVSMTGAGEITGYADRNGSNIKDADEEQLFKIEIDAERGRIIASDNSGYRRDHHYRPRFGFFTGYMLGSMRSRQSGFYTGARASSKPRYGQMSMSPKGYHASAVTKARARSSTPSSSARSRTGSRGFSFGK